jgi:hypothetical protein
MPGEVFYWKLGSFMTQSKLNQELLEYLYGMPTLHTLGREECEN